MGGKIVNRGDGRGAAEGERGRAGGGGGGEEEV